MKFRGTEWSPEEGHRGQAVRLVKGKRTQEQCVQHTEYTGIRTNPDGQGHHDEYRMKRAAAPHAYRMRRVLGDFMPELLRPGLHEVQQRARPEPNQIGPAAHVGVLVAELTLQRRRVVLPEPRRVQPEQQPIYAQRESHGATPVDASRI